MTKETYKIVRFYAASAGKRRTLRTGLSREQVEAHCSDPNTTWQTCTTAAGRRRTLLHGPWFDGFEKEK